jgi:hypothetical protein
MLLSKYEPLIYADFYDFTDNPLRNQFHLRQSAVQTITQSPNKRVYDSDSELSITRRSRRLEERLNPLISGSTILIFTVISSIENEFSSQSPNK